MELIVDCHTHLYPHYDLRQAFASALVNFRKAETQAGVRSTPRRALLLTERHDCNFLAELQRGTLSVPNFEIQRAAEDGVLLVRSNLGDEFFLVAGRQVVSAERLEILALLFEGRIADGTNAEEVIKEINRAGGVAVVNWAPGKWMFGRGRRVAELIEQFGDQIALGDTALRPSLWPEPSLIKLGQKLGLKVLVGSDPLPLFGEERRLAALNLVFGRGFDPARPRSSLREVLRNTDGQRIGSRLSCLELVLRLLALKFAAPK